MLRPCRDLPPNLWLLDHEVWADDWLLEAWERQTQHGLQLPRVIAIVLAA
jgi:hypothetical protein